ncbi:hypothetical protein [Candidatus Nitrosocosmicus sp. R]
MNDKRSILGNQFGFTSIAVIFLVTVPMLGTSTRVLGQNTTVPNIVNKTIVDDYDYYGLPIYYDEDNDNSDGGDNYYYTDDSGNNYYKDQNGNNYYTNAQGHHYWYDNDGRKYYYVDNNHNQKLHYDDNGNKVIHDNRIDSRTAYDNQSSGTHSHYAIYNIGNHVQPSDSGTFVHHTGVTHEHYGGGFSPQNGGGEHGGLGGRR